MIPRDILTMPLHPLFIIQIHLFLSVPVSLFSFLDSMCFLSVLHVSSFPRLPLFMSAHAAPDELYIHSLGAGGGQGNTMNTDVSLHNVLAPVLNSDGLLRTSHPHVLNSNDLLGMSQLPCSILTIVLERLRSRA